MAVSNLVPPTKAAGHEGRCCKSGHEGRCCTVRRVVSQLRHGASTLHAARGMTGHRWRCHKLTSFQIAHTPATATAMGTVLVIAARAMVRVGPAAGRRAVTAHGAGAWAQQQLLRMIQRREGQGFAYSKPVIDAVRSITAGGHAALLRSMRQAPDASRRSASANSRRSTHKTHHRHHQAYRQPEEEGECLHHR